MSEKIHVYAVLRIDEFEGVSGDEAISIKEILPTLEEAVQEVERLNKLRQGKHCHYFWRLTRYFPQGRAKGSDPEISSGPTTRFFSNYQCTQIGTYDPGTSVCPTCTA